MGRLTTHVLDTANGCPAAGVAISLFRIQPQRELIAQGVTNADGREYRQRGAACEQAIDDLRLTRSQSVEPKCLVEDLFGSLHERLISATRRSNSRRP